MLNDDEFPVPAYSPIGWFYLAFGLFYALLVRGGAMVYALVHRGKS